MTAGYFRAHIPSEWRASYEEQLQRAQRFAESRSRAILPVTWRDLKS